jgi:hypothetical protein
MPDKNESARSTVILAACAVLIGFYVILFGLQTMVFIEAHRWASISPDLKVVPQSLPSSAVSPVKEKDISFYGYDFDAPWEGIEKKTDNGGQAEVVFRSGTIILFFNPGGEQDILSTIRGGDPKTFQRYQDIFGSDLFPSNDALYSAVYNVSPSDISPFMSRDKSIRLSTLLQWKLGFGTEGASTIYNVQSGDFHGFQFGDPSRDRMIVVRLFDSHDQQIRLLFTSKSGQAGTISQADINCVIASIRPSGMGR